MGDEFQSGSLLLLGGILLKEDAAVVHLDGSRVLHAAELIARQHHHAILLEGTGDAGIALHPFQGLGSLVGHLVELCHLVGVGLAVENAHGATVVDGGLLLEVACDEGIQIGGELADVIACHGLPAVGHLE